MKFHFISSNSPEAIKAKDEYINYYTQTDPELSDIIIPIGGDGILLKSLHDFNELNKPFFGINYGSIGFLMNSDKNKKLDDFAVLYCVVIFLTSLEIITLIGRNRVYYNRQKME